MKIVLKIYLNGSSYVLYEDRFGYLSNINHEYYEKFIATEKIRSVVIKNSKVYINGILSTNPHAEEYVRMSVDDDIYERFFNTGKFI